MSKIKHILLVPSEGDPHGLLKEGPCGARPPTRGWWQCRYGHTSHGTWTERAQSCQHPEHDGGRLRPLLLGTECHALVLAWDGEPVAEVQPYIERAGIDYALLAPFVAYALKGMDIGQGPWPGTLVLLDAEGQEVSDE